jgi:hypothetical protein
MGGKKIFEKKNSIPLVLAGPIVRRATSESVWFWIALSEEITNIDLTIFGYGPIKTLRLPKMTPIAIQKQKPNIVRLGEHIWIALCEAVPLQSKFPTDTILGYDMRITIQEYNNNMKVMNLSELDLGITYNLYLTPTFIIGSINTTIAHGSCRRPGSMIREGEQLFVNYKDNPDSLHDAFGVFDKWMSEKAINPIERPSSLFLTGDQIYADDVAIPLFNAIAQVANDVFGYIEAMPIKDNNKTNFVPANKITWKEDGKWHRAQYIEYPKNEWGERKILTNLETSKIGFTTDDGEAHLLSFPEYAAMYLIIWNPTLCLNYKVDDGKNPTLSKYHTYAQSCRRVMANCSTYMLFDDHDVTDDWNLDEIWYNNTQSNITAKRIISNALLAYWCFQAWGNDPKMFDKSFVVLMSDHLKDLNETKGWVNDEFLDHKLLNMHWSYIAASNPKAICVDTRTLREFPKVDLKASKQDPNGKGAILSGEKVRTAIGKILDRYGLNKDNWYSHIDISRTLLVVLPTPFFPHPTLLKGQMYDFNYPADRYKNDFEFYVNNKKQRPELVHWLKKRLEPSLLVILSGDVHYGSVVYGGYAYGKSKDLASGKYEWKLPIFQITSSPIKNMSDKFTRKLILRIEQGTLRILVHDSEAGYSTDGNNVIAMGNTVANLYGDLLDQNYVFRNTFVIRNHICVVTLPNIFIGSRLKSLFIGFKEGGLKTCERELNVQDSKYLDYIKKINFK